LIYSAKSLASSAYANSLPALVHPQRTYEDISKTYYINLLSHLRIISKWFFIDFRKCSLISADKLP